MFFLATGEWHVYDACSQSCSLYEKIGSSTASRSLIQYMAGNVNIVTGHYKQITAHVNYVAIDQSLSGELYGRGQKCKQWGTKAKLANRHTIFRMASNPERWTATTLAVLATRSPCCVTIISIYFWFSTKGKVFIKTTFYLLSVRIFTCLGTN